MDPIEMLKARMVGKSLRAIAREIGCSAPYVSDVLKGYRPAGPKVLAFLGLEKIKSEVFYRKTNGHAKPKRGHADRAQ